MDKNYTPQTQAELCLEWLCNQIKGYEFKVEELGEDVVTVINQIVNRYSS
jgi:hypothetical protein